MILVVDASVALKWFFQNRADEQDCDQALNILSNVDKGRIQLVQPPHFIAEVAAVLAREKPEESEEDLSDLLRVEFGITQEPEIYNTAISLAMRYQHHVFDTLYHAVALNINAARLITADAAYYRKAKDLGRILLLQDFSG